MTPTLAIFKRELGGYFATPVAYVFIVIFLVLTGVSSFIFGGLFERNQADLLPFFGFHPILYLFLIPAISMRLWAEERKTGTVELLMTLPVTTLQAVLGKFLAAWAFTGIALVLTFPTWITVNYLGSPDNGVIVAGYLGSFLMAGSYLAIGSAISALTRNQVIAFVLAFVVCGIFVLLGYLSSLLNYVGLSAEVADIVGYFGFQNRFNALSKGVVYVRDLVYFASIMVCWLLANALILDLKKSR
ncbi:MAG: ABC transporter permease [Candidatus Sumerlaeia bacterium]|nr:ABC transporter permease [Candidatus Sumerlaeia bacterium]